MKMRSSARRSGRDSTDVGKIVGEGSSGGARKKRPGKEHCLESTVACPDPRLPPRLFATDRYPSRRLNVYSSMEYLMIVRDVLKGSPEFDRLLGSCFGSLFKLPVRRCSYASVIIHAMLTRQVVTKKRYEAWPVFGGNPLRFSMVEFGCVTGLPCGEYEDGYAVDYQPAYKEADYAYWDKLFDGQRDVTIPDVVNMVTGDSPMSGTRKLKLCLLIIVDGVLIASSQPARPTVKYVKLLESLNRFLAFPWGRESFYWTVVTMIPAKKVKGVRDDPEGELCSKLRQKTKKMTGLPLALQLVVYEAIPQILARLGGNDGLKIIDCERLPKHTGLNLADVLEAEHHTELIVQPMMEMPADVDEGWGVWDDEIDDRRVSYMFGLINSGYKFSKPVWGGGDAKEDVYDHEKAKADKKRKRIAVGPKPTGAVAGVFKQKRLSGYFRRPGADVNKPDVDLVRRVDALEKTVAWLKRKLIRRKSILLTPKKKMLCKGKPLRKKQKTNPVSDDDEFLSEEEELAPGADGVACESSEKDDSRGMSGMGGEGSGGFEDAFKRDETPVGVAEEAKTFVDCDGIGMDVDGDDSGSEEPPPVLVPLGKCDGVPAQWVEEGASGLDGAVLYRATTSKTYFVASEEVRP